MDQKIIITSPTPILYGLNQAAVRGRGYISCSELTQIIWIPRETKKSLQVFFKAFFVISLNIIIPTNNKKCFVNIST